ncbi:unnamed protein product [Sphenostylis stenocarpa]|uniref:Desiccation-related protein PCC13-62 n=1 Tax=Sphenostylis stenocarpa TaxID=92480 RepID=A0AA86S3B1_9FABA|nr:unnamed protein product [Sphenostylis stenocarpa]
MLRASSSDLSASQTQTLISDQDLLEFVLNIEYLSAEYFLYGAYGRGLDATAPELTKGGPPPIGGRKANLDPLLQDIFTQFALMNVGHLRAIYGAVKGFPEPLLNISTGVFGQLVDAALGQNLSSPFDVYANPLNFLLGADIMSYFTPVACVGITPQLQNANYKSSIFICRDAPIPPYNVKVSDFTDRISDFANRLGKEGIKSEGIVVPQSEGAEGKTTGNVIAGDKDSLAFERTQRGILRIIYGTGNEHFPGSFFPNGANGRIARSFLP